MFDSVSSQWDGILEVLIKKNQEKLMDSLDKEMLEDHTGFLTPLRDATDEPGGFEGACCLRMLWKTKVLPVLETKPYDL